MSSYKHKKKILCSVSYPVFKYPHIIPPNKKFLISWPNQNSGHKYAYVLSPNNVPVTALLVGELSGFLSYPFTFLPPTDQLLICEK